MNSAVNPVIKSQEQNDHILIFSAMKHDIFSVIAYDAFFIYNREKI